MSSLPAGVAIAVLGGDDREVVLVTELVRMGANVRVAGISKLAENSAVQCFYRIEDAVRNTGFIILPMPGTDEKGTVRAKYGIQPLVLTPDSLLPVRDGGVVIVGVARPTLREMVAQRGLKLVEIAEMDEVAILNSVPSAEGAIQMAMEATDITIHGSSTLVLGFGRCGVTLARMLAGLGAKTSVTARQPSDLARIREMGLQPLTYLELPECIGEFDIIFNTVPTLVLDKSLLEKVNPVVYICDIATAPGGIDYTAAEQLGLNAVLAPGLPGKAAPRTAGLILASIIPQIIINELNTSSSVSGRTSGNSGVFA